MLARWRMAAIVAKASMMSETWRCQPCQECGSGRSRNGFRCVACTVSTRIGSLNRGVEGQPYCAGKAHWPHSVSSDGGPLSDGQPGHRWAFGRTACDLLDGQMASIIVWTIETVPDLKGFAVGLRTSELCDLR
jgi:hypothetical protein